MIKDYFFHEEQNVEFVIFTEIFNFGSKSNYKWTSRWAGSSLADPGAVHAREWVQKQNELFFIIVGIHAPGCTFGISTLTCFLPSP